MSKIKLIIIVSIFSIRIMFSQDHNEYKRNSIYLDLNDRALESYKIDKDTMNAHFSVYFKKYQSKKERDKANEVYKDMVKNIRTSGVNPDKVRLPTFSTTFYVFNRKPEKLKSLRGIKFVTLKQFQDNNYRTSNPTYIIHKLKDGSYLRWLAITMDEI